jgi:hypothetical protein
MTVRSSATVQPMADSGGGEIAVVVQESSLQRDGLFGLLTTVFVVALVRGVHGAATTAGAIAAATFCGVIIVGLMLLWRVVRRLRSRLLVSADSIALVNSAGTDPKVLSRLAGDQLRFVVRGAGRSRYTTLAGGGDAAPLDVRFFSRKQVRQACLARGWRFD